MRIPVIALSAALLTLPLAAGRPTQAQALSWLDAKAGAADLDVAGAWESTASYFAGGWGSGTFSQTGNKVVGTLGPYSIEGRIAGKQFYVVFLSGAKVYYTAILALDKDGALNGTAIGKALADAPDAASEERAAVILVRSK
jgi:hypothetical protein